MLVYVAGPYRGEVERNIQQAREIAIELWEAGHVALCPHLNTAHFEIDCNVPDEAYLKGDLLILFRCDAVVASPDWSNSAGARKEIELAMRVGIPVYYYPEIPLAFPTNVSL
jgi:hypothetical protein